MKGQRDFISHHIVIKLLVSLSCALNKKVLILYPQKVFFINQLKITLMKKNRPFEDYVTIALYVGILTIIVYCTVGKLLGF